VLLFIKIGQVPQVTSSPDAERSDAAPAPKQVPQITSSPDAKRSDVAPAPKRTRVSPIFAVAILIITGGLGWWGWYELIRSPYLTYGFMTLQLQFRLPSGMALPSEATDVQITVGEGQQRIDVNLGPTWHGTDGDHRVILASASLMRKTNRRVVSLGLPGVPEQTWHLDLPNDPAPTPGYSPWRFPDATSTPKVEMNFRLSADR
jgi:hypothetical protein